MKKEETAVKMPEVKEGGASKPLRVVYSDKRKENNCFSTLDPRNWGAKVWSCILGFIVLIIFCSCIGSYWAGSPSTPQFTLDNLYLDPTTNSTMVNLSSSNPSTKSSIHYRMIRVYVWIPRDFKTETVHLDSTSTIQGPGEDSWWTAAVATNNDNEKRPGGSYPMRNGVTKGKVIVESSIEWKGAGVWNLINRSLRTICHVPINLKDLTSVVPKPRIRCSTSFI